MREGYSAAQRTYQGPQLHTQLTRKQPACLCTQPQEEAHPLTRHKPHATSNQSRDKSTTAYTLRRVLCHAAGRALVPPHDSGMLPDIILRTPVTTVPPAPRFDRALPTLGTTVMLFHESSGQ